MSERPPHLCLGVWSALATWCALLVVLNLTADPLLCATVFALFALVALVVGRRRLVVCAVVLGVGVAVAEPLLAALFASVRVEGVGPLSGGLAYEQPLGALYAVLAALRIPAEVVSVVLLTLVPAQQAQAALARVSARTALIGGVAARLGPLLARDARRAFDELRARGVRLARPAPFAERLRGSLLLWESLVAGAFDRAFATAAALDVRGYGAPSATTAQLQHPLLEARVRRARIVDAVLVLSTMLLCALVVTARVSGMTAPPSYEVFGGAAVPVTPLALLLVLPALLGGGTLLAALLRAHRAPAVHAIAASAPRDADAATSLGATGVDDGARTDGATVELRGVRVRYPGAAALALDVPTLQVATGEFVLLVGESGCGKSTLLDCVSGVVPHSTGGMLEGAVLVDGERVTQMSAAQRLGLVATVFQDPERQVVTTSVAEEVAFALRNLGLERRQIERRVLHALGELGCGHLAQRDTDSLSGGELQRVALAAALAQRPRVLLLDEPTSQLDDDGALAFWQCVDALRSRHGVTVIASDHRLEHVRARCDRIVALRAGTVSADVAERSDMPLAVPPAPVVSRRPLLCVRGLSLRAPHVPVVSRLDTDLTAGSIVALVGANGVGKSTLLRALAGLSSVTGAIAVCGVPAHAAGARLIGYLSQHAATLVAGATVREHAALTCRHLGLPHDLVDRALYDGGLLTLANRHPLDLSLGERQRLAIVAATAHAPALWLLDEPTGALDAQGRAWLAVLLARHRARGGVALVATHDPHAIALCSHRMSLGGGGACTVAMQQTPTQRVSAPEGAPA